MLLFFFFKVPAPTEIYTLSLHDALPILPLQVSAVQGLPSSVHAAPLGCLASAGHAALVPVQVSARSHSDRKSTRLNSSHLGISYAVFCLKKKKKKCCMPSHAHTMSRPLK